MAIPGSGRARTTASEVFEGRKPDKPFCLKRREQRKFRAAGPRLGYATWTNSSSQSHAVLLVFCRFCTQYIIFKYAADTVQNGLTHRSSLLGGSLRLLQQSTHSFVNGQHGCRHRHAADEGERQTAQKGRGAATRVDLSRAVQLGREDRRARWPAARGRQVARRGDKSHVR